MDVINYNDFVCCISIVVMNHVCVRFLRLLRTLPQPQKEKKKKNQAWTKSASILLVHIFLMFHSCQVKEKMMNTNHVDAGHEYLFALVFSSKNSTEIQRTTSVVFCREVRSMVPSHVTYAKHGLGYDRSILLHHTVMSTA